RMRVVRTSERIHALARGCRDPLDVASMRYDTEYQMVPPLKFVALAALAGLVLAACGTPAGGSVNGTLQVIAGENFWGSIAAQLGGSHASVTSIVTNPNTDPHDYESSATDAR